MGKVISELKNKGLNNKQIAQELLRLGHKPSCSTFIDEETKTNGYGELDSMGCFEYPLPDEKWRDNVLFTS